jgi:hypothetical protein
MENDNKNDLLKGKVYDIISEPLEKPSNNIRFTVTETIVPILELRGNGDILVKGKVIENDIEVVQALREFLTSQGLID